MRYTVLAAICGMMMTMMACSESANETPATDAGSDADVANDGGDDISDLYDPGPTPDGDRVWSQAELEEFCEGREIGYTACVGDWNLACASTGPSATDCRNAADEQSFCVTPDNGRADCSEGENIAFACEHGCWTDNIAVADCIDGVPVAVEYCGEEGSCAGFGCQ